MPCLEIAEEGKKMKQLTAKDIMTHDVLEAKEDWSLRRLVEFMAEHSISGAPVVSEEGKLIGVVSLTDILRHDTLPEKYAEPHGPHDYYLSTLEHPFALEEIDSFQLETEPQTTVRDIMTPRIFNVGEEASVQEVADMMINSHIHRVFVTRQEKVVGIISAVDMLRIIRDM
jgi:CBS domain-containing protein